jgi:hypothetical protein
MADDRITVGSGAAAACIALAVVGAVVVLHDPAMLPERHAGVMNALRVIVTGVFLVTGGIILIVDKFGPGIPHVDRQAFDWWTVPHTLLGVAFGIWFFPLLPMLVIVILWEVFERFAAGFGKSETFWNYFVDVAVAVAGWAVVVTAVMISMAVMDEDVFFPLVLPSEFFWS